MAEHVTAKQTLSFASLQMLAFIDAACEVSAQAETPSAKEGRAVVDAMKPTKHISNVLRKVDLAKAPRTLMRPPNPSGGQVKHGYVPFRNIGLFNVLEMR